MSKKRSKKVARTLSLAKLLSDNQWHSSLGFDSITAHGQRRKEAMVNNAENLSNFIPAGSPATKSSKRYASDDLTGNPKELLIHKSSRALWRISDDGRQIEPAFSDDIITIENGDG